MKRHQLHRVLATIWFWTWLVCAAAQSPRFGAFDREAWKQAAADDYSLAFSDAMLELEGRLRVGENTIDATYQLGYCAAMMGRMVEAEFWYSKAEHEITGLDGAKSIEEQELVSALWNNLGVINIQLQAYPRAMNFIQKSLELVASQGDVIGVRETLLNQATLLTRMQEFEQAEAIFLQVRSEFEAIGDKMSMAFVDFNLGRLYEQQRDWMQSKVRFASAETQLLNAGDSVNAANCCFENLLVTYRSGARVGIRELTQRMARYSCEGDSPPAQLKCAMSMGISHVLDEEMEKARGEFERATEILSEHPESGSDYNSLVHALQYAHLTLRLKDEDLKFVEQAMHSSTKNRENEVSSRSMQISTERESLESLADYLAELKTAGESARYERALEKREKVIYGIIALSLIFGTLGYRRYRKGQRDLIGIFSRRKQRAFMETEAIGEPLLSTEQVHSRQVKNELFDEIDRLMRQEKPFVDSNLSVGGLSQLVNANYTYVARAIQEGVGLGVAEYINRCRVDYIIELMLDKANDNYSLDYLAEIGGFSSVSTLYRQFKRFTGVTPGEFRKNL